MGVHNSFSPPPYTHIRKAFLIATLANHLLLLYPRHETWGFIWTMQSLKVLSSSISLPTFPNLSTPSNWFCFPSLHQLMGECGSEDADKDWMGSLWLSLSPIQIKHDKPPMLYQNSWLSQELKALQEHRKQWAFFVNYTRHLCLLVGCLRVDTYLLWLCFTGTHLL